VDFWNTNFDKLQCVKTSEFATAFVKRFQDGKDGFPVYPAEILYKIVDHFIARHNDFKAEEQITTKDLLTFVVRFGSLKTAVDTVTENFFDPAGEVHLWYHFDVTSDIINRKFVLEKSNSFAVLDHGVKHDSAGNHKNDSYTGDFVLRLRRMSGTRTGKKEEIIERIKDANGKVSYGARVVMVNGAPKQLDKPQVYKEGLLKYLKDRTSEYTPLQSSLWVGTHSVENKLADGTTEFKIGDKLDDDGLTSEIRDNMWKGYSRTGKTVSTLTYKEWEAVRAEKATVASTRYRQWQSAYATDVIKAAENIIGQAAVAEHKPHFESSRYAQASQLLSTPH